MTDTAQALGAQNTDKELWREPPGDYYADSIHVTEGGGIGINCGGYVIVMPLRKWHSLVADIEDLERGHTLQQKTIVEREEQLAQAREALQKINDMCNGYGGEAGWAASYALETLSALARGGEERGEKG